jgi:8-oxo-dGTP pyrophosphatase MutT (NUDIX family)
MYIKIYFEDKPVFLCDEIDSTINEYLHHPDAVFIDEISNSALKSLLHEIAKPEFHAGIIWNDDLEKLKNVFFKHFKFIEAAGGVILNSKKELMLIFRKGKWDMPKGKLDKGESLEDCAVREVEEETGLSGIKLGRKLTETYHTYTEFGKHILKESHWYRMKYSGSKEPVPQTEEGITEIKWVPLSRLDDYKKNTYATIVDVMAKAKSKE